MRLQNAITGDVLELPTPDELGHADVILNGKVICTALFSDANGGTVTLGDGRVFAAGDEFADFVTGVLSGGAV